MSTLTTVVSGSTERVPSGTKTGLALSIQQPWAWLIVNGYKPVENRDWSTKVRGVIGIHAGQKFDLAGYIWVQQQFPYITLPMRAAFQTGGIVGTATLIDCVREMGSPWFVGAFGFVLRDAKPLTLRPCRGMLGFFKPALENTDSPLITSEGHA
jgi:ASCH domain-containing protein